jgi:cytochrome c oxidase assembly protein Cox11
LTGRAQSRGRNLAVAAALGGVLLVMVGLVSYSVTLYRLFCEATGFGGTTRRVEAAASGMVDRTVTVRFNTDLAPGMPWRFEPVQREVTVKLGEEKLVYFRAENLSDRTLVGHATYNVTPDKAGPYFDKIQCFCFSEERLGPHETVEMPVDFFVDPKLVDDVNAQDVDTITLSYTFFPSMAPEKGQDLNRLAVAEQAREPDAERGADLFASRCATCHGLDRNKIGPSLAGIIGRPAATVAGFNYSEALRSAKLVWSPDRLDSWLADSRALVPGTRMMVRIADPQIRADILAYLARDAARPQAAANAASR